MAFHRKEQMAKLKAILKSLVTFKRVDNFNCGAAIKSRICEQPYERSSG